LSAGLKAQLRPALRRTRRALHAQQPDAGRALIGVFRSADLPCTGVVAVYRAAASEIDPAPLADWLRGQGARIVLPVAEARDKPLIFREATDGGGMDRDVLGLVVPPPDAPTLRPDLILAPLLGFDRRGGRIGQGGGYYDRTLAALRAEGPPVRAVGLAFSGQEVELVPAEPCDEPLDGVLTEKAYLPFA
jgi:5-formyltetrahydrofolate cyclo-ligase